MSNKKMKKLRRELTLRAPALTDYTVAVPHQVVSTTEEKGTVVSNHFTVEHRGKRKHYQELKKASK